MMVDKKYCMSSYLMFRTIADKNKCFTEGIIPQFYRGNNNKILVHNSYDLLQAIEKQMTTITKGRNAVLALSGGIDSAILAKYMPSGSKSYTFHCIVPGIEVINEIPQAKKYADECNLQHEIIDVNWSDFEKYAPILMDHKGAPIHSIEVQIYKAALKAKEDGYDTIIFGESADLNYGGLSDLLSKERTVGEFIDRYSYVQPYHVLKEFEIITQPYLLYEENGYINTFEFCRNFFLNEAMGSYTNACECAGIKLEAPYVNTWLAEKIDLDRIRKGENKYIIRDAFKFLYPNFIVPPKIPMPRPMDEWMGAWSGPNRPEFWQNCTTHMSGDQKWYVWALERFLNLIDKR